MPSVNAERALHRLGLESRRSLGQRVLPTAGGFGIGFGLGVGVGLLVAPKAGRELRAEVREALSKRFEQTSSDVEASAEEPTTSFESATPSAEQSVAHHSPAEA